MLLKRAAKRKVEINIIPMVDIVFQLIIFFLVATQVKKNEAADVILPMARKATEIKKDETPPLIVNVLRPEVNKVKPFVVMGLNLNIDEFKGFLKNRKESLKVATGGKFTMPALRIRADRDSQFKEIQDALIACRDIGIDEVHLSAIKKKD